jgi:hypothetical protein
MDISDKLRSKLQDWVAKETWYTKHDNDMERFYLFVDAFVADYGYHIGDEQVLAEAIASEADVKTGDSLFEVIKDRVSLMYSILDFLKATRR